jgi:hypothetical protein
VGIFSQIKDVLRYSQLPKVERKITFYSEGRNYWPHLKEMLKSFLDCTDIPVCYVSSNPNDPGLSYEHPKLKKFEIGEGSIRDWFFANLDTDVMVMTMPDLHKYQVKRSKHNVHYVYVQHSLVSQHMAYREGAFDHFDTVFCSGPHHVKELRALEARYKLPSKNLVEHGYARLDEIIEQAKKEPKKIQSTTKHILIAPTWGENATIESGHAEKIVDQLIENKFKVTLRPHPQTLRFSRKKIDAILKRHSKNPLFSFEANVDGQKSLQESDIMISDWSGAALDYAFGLKKPVLFVDVPRKVNNPKYEEIDIEPFEAMVREKIGAILTLPVNVDDIEAACHISREIDPAKYVFNVETSAKAAADELLKLLNK